MVIYVPFLLESDTNFNMQKKELKEALRSNMVRDLFSPISFLKSINHAKSTGSFRLQRLLFYSFNTEVISRAAAIVCIIDLLMLPDKIHLESVTLTPGCQ